MRKRLLATLLALCMALMLLPAEALAKSDTDIPYAVTGGNIYFDAATGTITYCDGDVTEAEIPSAINGVAVTSIGERAFSNCGNLTDVTISDGVTSIGDSAFFFCRRLTSIMIPASVASVGNFAFADCRLTSISVDPENSHYASEDGVLFDKQKSSLICYPAEKSNSSYAIPASVTSIGDGAFYDCRSLTSVTIPDGVTSIGDFAFYDCRSLTSVTIPDGVTSIGDFAFHDCGNLTSITIPYSVTSIGENAFATFYVDSRLTDVYYSGSEAQWKAISIGDYNDDLTSATIHYNSTGMGGAGENPKPDKPGTPDKSDSDMSLKKVSLQFDGWLANRINSISVNWGWGLFSQSAVKNNAWDIFSDNNLAITGLILSRAVEQHRALAETIYAGYLGFDTVGSYNYNSSANQHPAVTFACKQLTVNGQEQYVFAIAVRGTSNLDDVWTDISSLWGGFETAANNLYRQLGTFMGRTGLPDSDIPIGGGGRVKFFVTGHSLGGAVANIMAKKLSDIYGADNVFAYTFASPTTIRTAQTAGNIFNILNVEDGFTRIPGASDHRYGWEVWFNRDLWAPHGFYDRFKELVGREFDDKDTAHATEIYMSYLLSMTASRTTKVTLLRILCPVDVEVYDSNNQLVGSVKNNVAGNAVDGKTYIRVADDKKYIYVLDDDEYIVKLTGTDDGVMTYAVQNIDAEMGETAVEQVFENVVLTAGKQFVSEVRVEEGIATDVETQEVRLYVLDGVGEPEKEVLPDGNGTEVPIGMPDEPNAVYTISFDTTVISLNIRPVTTNTEGKLSRLPSPTRDGYTFDGWFTAAIGGEQITTETIFDRNTTVYAHWTYVGSGFNPGDTATNPGNSGYYPGNGYWNNYTQPTYAITVLSPANGTIAVTPQSASKGSTVIITATPDNGYQLETLTVSDSNGKAIELTDKGSGKYTFTMPDGKVTVNAVFRPIPQPAPEPEKPWSNPFTDITADAWYYEAVRFVQENGLMSGYGDGIFAPSANLSRAMLAQILYNKEGRPAVAGSAFTDVADGAWYSDAVSWAAAKGIVDGYGNGLFGPNDNITREQLAVMLWRYAGQPAANVEPSFSDADQINSFAQTAIRWAAENKILSGKGNNVLDPRGFATRAEVAQMLKNYLDT